MPKKYSELFKAKAVARCNETGSISDTAREYGIGYNTLLVWNRTVAPYEGQDEPELTGEMIMKWLLNRLPADGTWTQGERDRWMTAYFAILDLTISVVDGE